MIDDAVTGMLPLISWCAFLDKQSAGILGPTMWINVSSIADNLNSRASAVAFSLVDDFTKGMWSVNAVTLLFFRYVMKCSNPATNPHNSALYALYLDSESLNCLEKYAMGLVTPFCTWVKIAPTPPLIGGSACGLPTLASTNIWNGNEKSGNAITGLEAIMPLSLYHASIAFWGRSPESLYDLQLCSWLVTADNGPAINA